MSLRGGITRYLLLACLLSAFPALSARAAEDPLPAPTAEPIYLETIAPMTVEGKESLNLFLNQDYDRCRDRYGDNYWQGCRRKLGLAGQKAAQDGIAMLPQIPGEWRWQDDYLLVFTPQSYWDAGRTYTIRLDLDKLNVPSSVTFTPRARTATFEVAARPLEVTFENARYMQDPSDPARKLAAADINFNYPVPKQDFTEKLKLGIESETGGKLASEQAHLEPEITHSPGNRSLKLAVPLKTLPDQDRYMTLTVQPDLKPEFGGLPTNRPFEQRIRIPSLRSYLALNQAETLVARREDGTPEQILSLETNVKASPETLLKAMDVYVLPAQHPVMKKDGAAKDKPYEWKAVNEVSASILAQSQPLTLTPMAAKADTTRFGFAFDAPAGRYLLVRIRAGLPAFGGYTLEKPYETIVQAPDYPHDVDIMQQGSILTLSGAKTLSLQARGTDMLRVGVAQIMPGSLQHFISQTSGDIRTPYFRDWNFGREDIARLDTKDIPMAYAGEQTLQYAAFDFTPYLEKDRKGVFLLSLQGMKDGKPVGEEARRFVLVTDTGLLLKENADRTREVFALSFASGKPVSGASVEVLGRNGLPVFTADTGADGHAVLPDFSGADAASSPVAVVVRKAGDYAFIPYERADRQLNFSAFATGGNVATPEGLNALLFSDRGIYRPGETIDIGVIVQDSQWKALPPHLPLRLTVTDSRGKLIHDAPFDLSAPGIQDFRLETGAAWPTGFYTAQLLAGKDSDTGARLGAVAFRVEDFMPDRLKLKAVFLRQAGEAGSATGWVHNDELRVETTLTNLYGTPASERRVTGNITLAPATLSFKGWDKYRFYDAYAPAPRAVTYDLPDGMTDARGKTALDPGLDRQEQATYNLTLEARGFDAGSGRGVTAFSTILVSPMDYALGYTTTANTAYLRKGQRYTFRLTAIDSELKPRSVENLSLTLIRKNYVSTLVRRNDGAYVYEAVPEEEILSTRDISLLKEGQDMEFPTTELGDYLYRITDKSGRKRTEIAFSVAGEGQRETGADREAVLSLKTDHDSYAPGDTVEVNITAPYTGAGLLTLESDKVVAYKWFRTTQTDTVQSLQIPAGFAGKGYINVAFVRDINSPEIYMTPLSYAVLPIAVRAGERTVDIALTAPDRATPGQPLSIAYKGNRKGKAIIFAVDEGILQVAKYKTPDPVDFFLLDRALQVSTAQMLDLLMPEYNLLRDLSATGGDAMAQAEPLGRHLNPFQRRINAPAVFWSGIVDLDPTEKTVTFTPPDYFSGELRVMAVAVADGAVGSTARAVTVRSDLVVTPNLPVFLAPGDRAQASVTIANGIKKSGRDAALTLTLTPSDGLTVKDAPATLTVPEGEEKSLTFTLVATDSIGPATLGIKVSSGAISQTVESTLSIRPATPKEATLTGAYAAQGKADIQRTRELYPQFASRRLVLSSLPTSYIYGLRSYLEAFPYGCSEQILSRAYPQLSLYGLPEFGIQEQDVRASLEDAVALLRQRQTPEGGFALWEAEEGADEFVTAYAAEFLLTATETGLPVPSDLLQNALRYLRERANQTIETPEMARVRAYEIYVLTRGGIVTSNEILNLLRYFETARTMRWQTDISGLYLAAAYEMMQQKDLAAATLAAFEKAASVADMNYAARGWSAYDSPFIKYTRYISILARHFPDRLEKMDRQILFRLAGFITEQRYNTLSAAFAIQALRDYTRAGAETLASAPVTVRIDGKETALPEGAVRAMDVPPETQTISIDTQGRPVFYTLTETGFSRNAATALSQGLEISRAYETADGKKLTGPVALGDVIVAAVTVRSHTDQVDNVALVELLPGGFDPELETASGSTWQPDYVDRREDRVIAFGTVYPTEQTFRYRLRATGKGHFVVPAPFAEALYDPTLKARGQDASIEVQDHR